MALTICPECSSSVSSSAKKCPHCGKRLRHGILAQLLVVLVGFAVVFAVVARNSAESQQQADAAKEAKRVAALTPEQRAAETAAKEKSKRLEGAEYACEKFVKASLHDPGSAEFDVSHPVKEEKGGVYFVQVQGRAKNALNATRRLVVNCRTTTDGKGSWTLVSLKEL